MMVSHGLIRKWAAKISWLFALVMHEIAEKTLSWGHFAKEKMSYPSLNQKHSYLHLKKCNNYWSLVFFWVFPWNQFHKIFSWKCCRFDFWWFFLMGILKNLNKTRHKKLTKSDAIKHLQYCVLIPCFQSLIFVLEVNFTSYPSCIH